jgi:hypothetical protein
MYIFLWGGGGGKECFFLLNVLYCLSIETYITYKSQSLSHSIFFTASAQKRDLHIVGLPIRESNPDLPYSKPTHYYLSPAAS